MDGKEEVAKATIWKSLETIANPESRNKVLQSESHKEKYIHGKLTYD